MTTFSKFKIVKGVGTSHKHQISAFDAALVDAGIGDYNLVRVSSILPPTCVETDKIDLEPGSVLHTAWCSVSYNGLCSAGIAIVRPVFPHLGLIIEIADTVGENELEKLLKEATKERLKYRNMPIDSKIEMYIISNAENILKRQKVKETCVFAGVALF